MRNNTAEAKFLNAHRTGKGGRKKKRKTLLCRKLCPSPARRTPSLTLTRHLISQVPKPGQNDVQRQRKREVEGRGGTRGEVGGGGRAGAESWQTMVTQFVSAG